MPYQAEWLIPLRVIYAKTWGIVTVEDLDEHTETCLRFLTEAQTYAAGKKAYLLLDMLETEHLPPMYLMIRRAMPVLQLKNRGPMFLITKQSAITSMLNLTAYIMHFQMRTFGDKVSATQAVEALMLQDDLKSTG
ncbi:MAG: hypothetical protein K8I82_06400 [Anaerolineae bacterium]|nr:hypothetical protein [Anaerolineae bacterium]